MIHDKDGSGRTRETKDNASAEEVPIRSEKSRAVIITTVVPGGSFMSARTRVSVLALPSGTMRSHKINMDFRSSLD